MPGDLWSPQKTGSPRPESIHRPRAPTTTRGEAMRPKEAHGVTSGPRRRMAREISFGRRRCISLRDVGLDKTRLDLILAVEIDAFPERRH